MHGRTTPFSGRSINTTGSLNSPEASNRAAVVPRERTRIQPIAASCINKRSSRFSSSMSRSVLANWTRKPAARSTRSAPFSICTANVPRYSGMKKPTIPRVLVSAGGATNVPFPATRYSSPSSWAACQARWMVARLIFSVSTNFHSPGNRSCGLSSPFLILWRSSSKSCK